MGRFGTGQGTLEEVRDGSGHPRMGRNGLGDPPKGLGRVDRPSRRSGTGRGTLEEVWNE